jgi:archaellum biogenesis ATPase FlaH
LGENGARRRNAGSVKNQLLNDCGTLENVREFPPFSEANVPPLETFIRSVLAPPKLQNENAVSAGPRNGATKSRNNPLANYQTNTDNATDFDDILGTSRLPAIEARRVDLVRNGYNPTPVNGKAAVLRDWSKTASDEWDARRWSTTHSFAKNTGIVLGENLVAIDVDILDRSISAPLINAADLLGSGAPLVRVGQAPKTLLLFRTDRPIQKRSTGKYRRAEGEKEQGVEILGSGQQFVAEGIHPDTGKPYQWIGESPLDVQMYELPLIDHARLEAFMQDCESALSRTGWRKIKGATGGAKPDLFDDIQGHSEKPQDRLSAQRCREIVADLPSEWRENRDMWIRAGMALHFEFDGSAEGFAIWDTWSHQSAKYDAQAIKRDWRSFRDKSQSVTMGTLIQAGEEIRQARIDRQLDDDIEDLGDEGFSDVLGTSEKPKVTSKLTFLTPSDCAAMPSRGYVIKGFIAPGDVACVFGEPGAGKSMIAPYLGYMVAQGNEAFGMRTKQGGVFYVPSEDETGMQMRVRALREQHGDADDFFVVRGVNIGKDDGLKDLLLEIKRQRPSLIVIDTLAAAFPGLEENSSEAMSRVVNTGKRLAAFGAAVVFIHHSTKDSNGTPRGHSVLNGALDVSMELFKADEHGIVRGRLKKNRNGPCDRDVAFRIQSHEFGVDEDGDPVTAGYCEPCLPGSVPKSVRLTVPQKEALTILRDMVATSGDMSPSVAIDDWRKRCSGSAKISASDNPKSVLTAVRRAIEGLSRAGLVEKMGDYVIIDDPQAVTADEFDDLGEL